MLLFVSCCNLGVVFRLIMPWCLRSRFVLRFASLIVLVVVIVLLVLLGSMDVVVICFVM